MIIYIEEILPTKFFNKCIEKTEEGWDLMDITTEHFSGYMVYKATFRKYE
jgi:hypothetical protein